MLVPVSELLPALRCPRKGGPLRLEDDTLVAPCGVRYPMIDGIPVLVDFEDSVLSESDTLARAGETPIVRPRHRGPSALVKRLLSPEQESTRRNVRALVDLLPKDAGRPRMLVVGGGSIGKGMEPLYDDPAIDLVAFDIYRSANTQILADAHSIPLPDGYFDAVVVQAVLEHVLEPWRVVDELWRVLKEDGVVYAETPFMQHVHEGAYDFTRFTESGHRYLFRRFSLIASGASAGPGLQFMWAADYLARSLFRSRAAGKVAKLAVFWAQYLDRLIPERYAIDAASGVFFLGRKQARAVGPDEIIAHYGGAQ